MANHGAKKRKEENERHVKKLAIIILVSNSIYMLFRMVVFKSSISTMHFLGVIFTSGLYWVTYEWLKDLSKATVNDDNELVDGGADMSGGGMTGYLHDILYITSFVQITTALISDKFWYTFLVIPMFALYKLWQMVLYPLFFQKQVDEPENEATRKKREKMERKASRPKFNKMRR